MKKPADSSTPKKRGFKFNIESTPEGIRTSILNHLKFTLARDTNTATQGDWWMSTCMAVRDRIMERFIATMAAHNDENTKRVYYLSLEYLMGRLLSSNLHNAGLFEETKVALASLEIDISTLLDEEVDMGLGNGGLGRLAACFLDSLATLDYPAIGYGIYYEFGLFRQEFVNGHQVEHPDNWLQVPNPWHIMRPEYTYTVPLYGRVENRFDHRGEYHPVWVDTRTIVGMPWDIPICGYGGGTVNFLRLWESRASEEFDLQIFNEGGYVEAVREKAVGETISKVLYPNDSMERGRELRLVQQYFFVSCSLQDIIRRFRKLNDGKWESLPDKIAVHLNDTHPAVAVAELMRILIDNEMLEWDFAWEICRRTFAYTNHTLMPEALETWSVPLFEKVLPRHLQIIFEINRRFLEEEVEARWPGDGDRKTELSIIQEGNPKMIRMAYLAVVASHSINGVAALHTRLLKSHLFQAFTELYPKRFNNKTNGITPRRWLQGCNRPLAALIDEKVGNGWPADLEQLRKLGKFADDRKFQNRFMAIKRENKESLARLIAEVCELEVDPSAIFDVQIKRLHAYKRQHLNLLHILTLYRRLVHHPDYDMHPRVFIFAAKAAPGYELAKMIIKAINAVASKINRDPHIQGKLKVAFLPNYGVTLAERIIPAADVSEQISTAGKEASGTGNMKLALNGAVTIGTLDGANVEIKEEVGADNIFIFGKTVEEIEELQKHGYNPYDLYYENQELRLVLDWLGSSYFTPDEPRALNSVRNSLLDGGDPFMVLADYEEYCRAQRAVDEAYRDEARWARMAIVNTARMGKFSSDRTIHEYARDVWDLKPLPVA
jgi:starch phosphorylase